MAHPVAAKHGRSRITIRIRYRGEDAPPGPVAVAIYSSSHWPATSGPDSPFPFGPVVEGKDGVIETVAPVRGGVQVASVTAEGQEYPFQSLFLDLRDGGEYEILLDRAKPITLVLLDAKSGEPLPGARVYPLVHRASRRPLFGAAAFLPGRWSLGRVQTADERGAVELEAGSKILKLYVIADDRAWQAIRVLPTIGGEAIVRLLPGGQVRLHVEGWKELPHTWLRAFCDDPPFATFVPPADENGDLALVGVPAGKVRFEVVTYNETVLGAGEVEVVAGDVARLAIPTTPGVREGVGEIVRGSLRVPAAWRWPGGKVNATLRGRGAALFGAYAGFSFDVPAGGPAPFETGPVPPGRYELEIDEFTWRTEVEIRSGEPLDLVVPGPRAATLRFVDGATGAPLEPATLYCGVADIWGLPPLRMTPDRTVRTASDRIHVQAHARGYASLAESADMKEVVTFRMHREGSLRATLTLSGRPFGGEGLYVSLVREGTDEGPPLARGREWTPDVTGAHACQGVARIDGLRPGTWRLTMTEIAGIEPVRQTVEIRSGETTEAEIDLRRAR